MGNVVEPILADCGMCNRSRNENKEAEDYIRKVEIFFIL